MQRLCVLVTMGACLVASAPYDVALTVQRGPMQLDLTSSQLTQLHMCLCTGDSQGCVYNTLDRNITSSHLEVTQNSISTEYLNAYMCTLNPAYVKCTRSNQIQQRRVDVQRKSNSFSLHNTDTCDISCVDVMWDDRVTNVTFYTNKISAELCYVKSLPGPPATTHSPSVIIISIMMFSIVLNIISAIFCIYVCFTRKRQQKNSSMNIPHVYNCLDVNTANGLYDVSSEPPTQPDLEREPGPLYLEII